MSRFIKWITTALFAVSMALVSTAMYADKGGNSEGGKGHGQGHGNSEKAHENRGGFKSEGHARGEQQELRGDDERSFNTIDNDEGRRVGHEGSHPRTSMRFSDDDRTTIINYFNANPFEVTSLPPGIAKNLARGKRLPPGIAKQYLPRSLFPAYPPQYEYVVVGRDVLLVDPTTNIIVDILSNLLR